ncbi:hypothetical protein BC936DRAFT_137477 [Jimgerdemannia flammicorona]|uniref:ADP-ribosylation factor n=1 Tax=Jimgerdemannia flammicorona TaxID=994334 RepID=A0A433DJ02_9FUNG|nr:hypothetical protein BC936DRAFT_137477 [Jimgerdemannia flammicorona]
MQTLLFIIDCNDQDLSNRAQALEDVRWALTDDTLREQNPFVVIACNKQDAPGATTPDEIRTWLMAQPNIDYILRPGRWALTGCSANTGHGISDVVELAYQGVVTKRKARGNASTSSSASGPSSSSSGTEASSSTTPPPLDFPSHPEIPSRTALEDRIRETTDTPVDHNLFLAAICSGTLTPFDHRAHLRLAYIHLVRSAARNEPQALAVNQITSHLKEFFRNADPTRIRPTYHETMTRFWSYIVAYEIMRYAVAKGGTAVPTEGEFEDMLRYAPHLMWGGLWKVYYTKGRLLEGEPGQEAKRAFVFPDVKILPSYTIVPAGSVAPGQAEDVTDEDGDDEGDAWELIRPTESAVDDATPSPYDLSDDVLLDWVEAGRMLAFLDDRTFIRLVFLHLRRAMMAGQRRGDAVTRMMVTLESTLMRIRGRGAIGGMYGGGDVAIKFSETKVYFWTQIVWQGLVAQAGKGREASGIGFNKFRDLCPECRDVGFWKVFYSEKVWLSVEANMGFVLPDRKPLPNVLM